MSVNNGENRENYNDKSLGIVKNNSWCPINR